MPIGLLYYYYYILFLFICVYVCIWSVRKFHLAYNAISQGISPIWLARKVSNRIESTWLGLAAKLADLIYGSRALGCAIEWSRFWVKLSFVG